MYYHTNPKNRVEFRGVVGLCFNTLIHQNRIKSGLRTCWYPKISSQSNTARLHQEQSDNGKKGRGVQHMNGYRRQMARSHKRLRIMSKENVDQSHMKAPNIQIRI